MKETLWRELEFLQESALGKNHYELAAISQSCTDPKVWKEFLLLPEVQDWMQSEMAVIQNAELQNMAKNASESRSTGQAQLMSALQKLNEKTATKEGPAFIYCYVPVNSEQEQADNVVMLDKDPFKINEMEG